MKILLTSTLLILFFISCNKQSEQTSTTDSLAMNDTLASTGVPVSAVSTSEAYDGPQAAFSTFSGKHLRIPINESWRDPHYVLIVVTGNPGNQEIPVYATPGDPEKIKPASYIRKTTQTRWYAEQYVSSSNQCLADWGTEVVQFFEIATGPGAERGWVRASDVLLVEEFNMAQYSFLAKSLTLGLMKKRYKADRDNCTIAQTYFLHNNNFIYLLDAGNVDEHLPGEDFISLIDHPNMGSVSGQADKNAFLFQWGVPGGRVVLSVGPDGDFFKCYSYDMTAVEGDMEEGVGEGEPMDEIGSEDEEEYTYTDEVFTKECEFQDYSIGDCGHMEFSCGDFGNADKSELTEAEKEIWYDLAVSTDDGETGNPKYVGKTFVIKYTIVRGDKCGDPSGPQIGPIEKLISFTLKK